MMYIDLIVAFDVQEIIEILAMAKLRFASLHVSSYSQVL